jgi:dTDP-4-amino-4,6-dideoxygalactose transaminase
MTEFQAAILLAQLARLEEHVSRRQRSAALIEEALADIPAIRRLAPALRMTRRSYHMYIFRLDETELGISRKQFLAALQAEGVPASEGWYRPLYRNGVFANAHVGPPHGIRAPLAGMGVDYRGVSCPVCEQVCNDAVWIPHNVLLADEPEILRLAEAIRKVIAGAPALRQSS